MARVRDTGRERARGRARDLELGYSVSQSRGHPRKGELSKGETQRVAKLSGVSLPAVIRWTALTHYAGTSGGTSMFMVPRNGVGLDTNRERDGMQALRGFAAQDLMLTSVIGTRANGRGVKLRAIPARVLLEEAEFAGLFAAIEALKFEFHDTGSPKIADVSPIHRVHMFAAIPSI